MKRNISIVLAAWAIVASLGALAADPFEQGVAAYHHGDYAKAADLWGSLAEDGNATAQYSLGSLYAEGKGVPQSDATAFKWFKRAADQGNAAAQYNVGASYAAGTGVERSDADAAKWFRRAADQDMVFAQFNLGLLYASGHGVPQDNVQALTWLEIALQGLPAGASAMDVAHAIQDVAAKMTREQIDLAKLNARDWAAGRRPK